MKCLFRLKKYIEDFPEKDILIITKNKQISLCYSRELKDVTFVNKKPFILSGLIDGFNPEKAILILGFRWYENKVSETFVFKYYLKTALSIEAPNLGCFSCLKSG